MKWRNRWLITIMAIIVMAMTFVSNIQQVKAESNTIWALNTYSLSVDSDGNIYVTSNRWLDYSKGTADDYQNYLNKNGPWTIYGYIVTNRTNDPHPDHYLYISQDKFTSGYDDSIHHVSAPISREQFDSYFIKGSATNIYKYTGSTYVYFSGYNVYHYAYFFSNGDPKNGVFSNLDNLCGGKASKSSVLDPSTAYYRIYDSGSDSWGDWTAVSGGLSEYFYRKDYKSGDKVEYKTISATGVESNTESYTFPTYELTLDANGGSVTTSKYTMSYGKTDNSTVNVPTKTGYDFQGWYTSSSGGTQVYDSNGQATKEGTYINSENKWCYLKNKTLYAHWTPSEYTLTIDPNGGEMYNGDNKTSNKFTTIAVYARKTYLGNLTSENKFYSDNKPTRTGYAFNGFTFSNGTGGLNSSGNTFYFSNTEYGSTKNNSYIYNGDHAGNVTATAGWTPYKLKITYDANGGTFPAGATTYQEIKYDESKSLSYRS